MWWRARQLCWWECCCWQAKQATCLLVLVQYISSTFPGYSRIRWSTQSVSQEIIQGLLRVVFPDCFFVELVPLAKLWEYSQVISRLLFRYRTRASGMAGQFVRLRHIRPDEMNPIFLCFQGILGFIFSWRSINLLPNRKCLK